MNKKNNIMRSKKTCKYHFQRFYLLKYVLNYIILITFNSFFSKFYTQLLIIYFP